MLIDENSVNMIRPAGPVDDVPAAHSLRIDVEAMRRDAVTLLSSAVEAERHSDSDGGVSKRPFPVLSQAAYHGLAGEIVRLIEPHTEADNTALLIQLLAGFGSLIGRTAYFRIGADFHYTKLFVVLVGATATGRKGTSWSEIQRLLTRVDSTFRDVIQNGLSSGEGLIFHVRDENKSEKRAFVIEPEFARVLKVITRQGNTLSSVIRQAWDTDRLSILTKNDPIKASETHISISGHITEIELLRNLQETETANGFANRFIWTCVRRSKYLPDGGSLADADLDGVVERLRRATEHARNTGELIRDPAASQKWRRIYRPLSDGFTGLVGSVTSRATAQVMRLACVYALLDCSREIRLEHLEAAIALWRYSEDSAKYVFGVSTGDKLADGIYKALEENNAGLSRTDIHDLCGRNRPARELGAAIDLLVELGRIEGVKSQTGGRPSEIFRLKPYEENE